MTRRALYDTCIDCHEFTHIYGKGRCRKCYNVQWRKEHPEAKARNALKERARRKLLGDAYRQSERDRNIRRKEGRTQYNREYYSRHAEELKQYQKDYRIREREKTRHMWRVTKLRRRKIEVNITIEQWNKIVDFYCPNNQCPACRRILDAGTDAGRLSMDHVIPMNMGGTTDPGNIQPLCQSCNASKSDNNCLDYRFDGGAFARSLMSENES